MMNSISLNEVRKTIWSGERNSIPALRALLNFNPMRRRSKRITLLENITFSASTGESIAVIGDNGSGKSTLLRVIAGIYSYDSGTIDISGNIVSLIDLKSGFKERLTVRENAVLVLALFGADSGRGRVRQVLEYAGLNDRADEKLYKLSTGMQQRLAFSVAVHSNPQILLLDEVFEVGDNYFKEKAENELNSLKGRGSIIFLVSHDMKIVQRFCDKAMWIDNGTIKSIGSSSEVCSHYSNSKSSGRDD